MASPHLLEELATVLARNKFRRYVTLEEAEGYVETLGRRVEFHPDSSAYDAVTSDPDDDYLVALARAVEADAIVSGDDDLLECVAAQPVLSARAVIQRLSAGMA